MPSKKLKLETLSEQDMKSRERAGGSLKDLFEFSDEAEYSSIPLTFLRVVVDKCQVEIL